VSASHSEAAKDQVVVPLTMEEYCIKAKSKPSTVNDNIDMTDFYDDDYDDYEDDEEDEEEAGDDTDDSGNGES